MITILGANGAIANQLAFELLTQKKPVRLVSRNPKPLNRGEVLVKANLLDATQVNAAVAGSNLVYLTAGLTYSSKVWQKEWPLLMENVIRACQLHQARLVFFDNVYAYGKVNGPMTESTPYNPCSKKGEVRAQIANFLQQEMGNQQLIARAADFIGQSPMSFLSIMVFERLAQGKSAQWMVDPNQPHTYTYIPDTGKALDILGSNPENFGQVWHLPSHPDPITGTDLVNLAAQALQTQAKISTIPKPILYLLGWFVPVIRESYEMLYQLDSPYHFNSQKFKNSFGDHATPIHQAIQATALAYQKP
ncbi:MAG: NAD(P)H-binding protein [Bacteroidia bacterium]|nr:NAD(P)H-binding protein [Bacteroidia bacterium]